MKLSLGVRSTRPRFTWRQFIRNNFDAKLWSCYVFIHVWYGGSINIVIKKSCNMFGIFVTLKFLFNSLVIYQACESSLGTYLTCTWHPDPSWESCPRQPLVSPQETQSHPTTVWNLQPGMPQRTLSCPQWPQMPPQRVWGRCRLSARAALTPLPRPP